MTGEPGGFYLEKGGLRPVRDIKNLRLLHHVAEMRKNQKGSGAVRQPPPTSTLPNGVCTLCARFYYRQIVLIGLAFNFHKKGDSKKFGGRFPMHRPPFRKEF